MEFLFLEGETWTDWFNKGPFSTWNQGFNTAIGKLFLNLLSSING
jgi:hypothetical protein